MHCVALSVTLWPLFQMRRCAVALWMGRRNQTTANGCCTDRFRQHAKTKEIDYNGATLRAKHDRIDLIRDHGVVSGKLMMFGHTESTVSLITFSVGLRRSPKKRPASDRRSY